MVENAPLKDLLAVTDIEPQKVADTDFRQTPILRQAEVLEQLTN